MARCRVQAPDQKTLTISDGDWLLVKKRLNAGEARRVFERMVKTMHFGDERPELVPFQVGRSQAVEYLIDWSLVDPTGQRIAILDKSADDKGAALDSLDVDSFNEIVGAITAHDAAMREEREAEKNARDGESKSSRISPSAA